MKQAYLFFILIRAFSLPAQHHSQPQLGGDVLLIDLIPPCPPDVPNCCSVKCGDNETCLCECFLVTGKAMRQQERFADAVKFLQVAARLCPEEGAQAQIDSIYQEQRIWVYQNGKFAIATPLGEMVTPFVFSNSPEPFHKGIAIFSEGDKYFFVDKNGNVLTSLPGYNGIIKAIDNIYCLIGDGYIGLALENGVDLNYRVDKPTVRYSPSLLYSLGEWNSPQEIKNFFATVAPKKYDQIECFYDGLAAVKTGGQWGIIDKFGNEVIRPQYDFVGGFREGLALVGKNNYFGFVDKNGKVIIPLNFENAWVFSEGLSAVTKEGQRFFIDKSGKKVFSAEYDNLWPFQEGIAIVEKNSKMGAIDKNGKEIIPLEFDIVWPFLQGQACVKKQNKWGVIDKSAQEITPLIYDKIFSLNKNGHRWVVLDGKRSLINRKGETLIPPQYESVGTFQYGLAWAKEDGKFLFIDTSGRQKTLFFSDYPETREFHEGLVAIKNAENEWGFLDENYVEIIKPQYVSVSDFHEGYACVQRGRNFGYIDATGTEKIPVRFDKATPFKHGVSIVKKGNYWGMINKHGSAIVEMQYDSMWMRENDLVFAMKNNKIGILDTSGKVIVPSIYESIRQTLNAKDFSVNSKFLLVQKRSLWGGIDANGKEVFAPVFEEIGVVADSKLILFKMNGKFGFMDWSGHIIVSPQYQLASDFINGRAAVFNGKWGFIDITGELVIRNIYDEVGFFSSNLAPVKIGNEFGYIDKIGNVVIPFQYSNANSFLNGCAIVQKDHHAGLIDTSGNLIIPIKYENVWPHDKLDLIIVSSTIRSANSGYLSNKSNYGLYNKKGESLIPCMLDDYSFVFKDKILLIKDGKKGLYSITDKVLIMPEYDDIAIENDPDVSDSWILVQKNGKWGWINQNGEVKIPCKFSAATQFNAEGWALVLHYNDQTEVTFRINRKGEMIWEKE